MSLCRTLQPRPHPGSRLNSPQAELVILGGAFFVNGNINPAAEANIFGDPEAADFVLGQPVSNVRMVGLDVTHEVTLTSLTSSRCPNAFALPHTSTVAMVHPHIHSNEAPEPVVDPARANAFSVARSNICCCPAGDTVVG